LATQYGGGLEKSFKTFDIESDQFPGEEDMD